MSLFGPTFDTLDERTEWDQPMLTSACSVVNGPSNCGTSCWINSVASALFYPSYVRVKLFRPVLLESQAHPEKTALLEVARHIATLTSIFSQTTHIFEVPPNKSPAIDFYNSIVNYTNTGDPDITNKLDKGYKRDAIIGIFKGLQPFLKLTDVTLADVDATDVTKGTLDAQICRPTDTLTPTAVLQRSTYLNDLASRCNSDVILFSYAKSKDVEPLDIIITNGEYSLVSCTFGIFPAGGGAHDFSYVRCNHNSEVWLLYDAYKSPNQKALPKRTGFSFTLNSFNPFNKMFGGQALLDVRMADRSIKQSPTIVAVYARNSRHHATLEAIRSGDVKFLEKRTFFNNDGTFVVDEFGHTPETALLEHARRYDLLPVESSTKFAQMRDIVLGSFSKQCKDASQSVLTKFVKMSGCILADAKSPCDLTGDEETRLIDNAMNIPLYLRDRFADAARKQKRPRELSGLAGSIVIPFPKFDTQNMVTQPTLDDMKAGTRLWVYCQCLGITGSEWKQVTLLSTQIIQLPGTLEAWKVPGFLADDFNRGFYFDFIQEKHGPLWIPNPRLRIEFVLEKIEDVQNVLKKGKCPAMP